MALVLVLSMERCIQKSVSATFDFFLYFSIRQSCKRQQNSLFRFATQIDLIVVVARILFIFQDKLPFHSLFGIVSLFHKLLLLNAVYHIIKGIIVHGYLMMIVIY